MPWEQKYVDEWQATGGAPRYDHGLNDRSLVMELGSFKGDGIAAFRSRFDCYVEAFEPMPNYFAHLTERFHDDYKVFLYPYGVGPAHQKLKVLDDGDGTSILRKGSTEIEIRPIEDVVDPKGADLIDINIEGAEYDLLDHMLDTGLVTKFTNIQIQFHDNIPGADVRRDSIRSRLAATHRETYCYPFVYENWRID